MKRKTCTKCRNRKTLDKFTQRKARGTYASWCKDCTAQATREGRQQNRIYRERNQEGNARRRRELKELVDALKAETPCTDCGYNYRPWQMQFDHVRGEKVGHVAKMVSDGCAGLVEEEIAKCEIVCANCHADRTHSRRNKAL